MKSYTQPLFAFALVWCTTACNLKSKEETPYIVQPVKVATVVSRGEVVKEFAGVVEATNKVELAFRLGGQLVELPVIEGQQVKKGDLIASINTYDLMLQHAAYKAAYETALQQLERNKRLLENEVISQQEYEISKANFEQSKSAYELSEYNLQSTQLYAPFDGSISKRMAENYQRIMAGTPIVELVNTNELEIATTLPDGYLYLLRTPHPSFSVTFANYRGTPFAAELLEYLEASPDGSGIPVTLIVTDPRFATIRNNIKPGFACSVTLTAQIDSYLEQPMTWIPLTAAFVEPTTEQSYVWVVRNSRVYKRPITLYTPTGESELFVSEGLNSGEQVVVAGVYRLVEGQEVKILP